MKAEIWNHRIWTKETAPSVLRARYDAIVETAGFHVVAFIDHHFNPQGYTALWLLSESHLAIHTFPEFGKTYVELSSCNLDYFKRFLDLLETNA